jgi:Ca-activated chloride channel family protein
MFADKIYLLLMLLVPGLSIFLFLVFRKRVADLALLVSEVNMPFLTDINLNTYKFKNILILSAIVFIVLALARPQFGDNKKTITKEFSEIIVALDISKSMLAQDLKPNRLEKAKEMMFKLIDDHFGDKIGVIVFTGSAMWQCPMTYDSKALKMFLQNVETNSLPIGGTQISNAIILAAKSVAKSYSDSKVMILITDGEDHDSKIKEAISAAKKSGLKIITVGIGTQAGSLVPVKDEKGTITDYIKDSMGKFVVSKMNSNLLKSVASETNGRYFDASGKDISGNISKAISNLRKTKNEVSERNSKIDRFQIFLFIALLLLFADLLFPTKRFKK